MKKQILSAILAGALCIGMVPTAVLAADGDPKTEKASDGSQWTVSGSTYVSNTRLGWPDYSFYPLGDTSDGQIVTLSADVTVGRKENEGEGGNIGFLFGAVDLGGNGVMNETGDYYYLVQVGTPDNEPYVGIERNDKVWGNWAQSANNMYQEGDVVTFTVTFNPKTMNFLVYADGKLVLDYTDGNPLPGAAAGQYGLASRVTDGLFENVDVAVGKTPDFIADSSSDTVRLTRDVFESIVIPKGRTVTLDLNGHRVSETLINYGTLTLTDSTGQGHIEVRKGYMNRQEAQTYAVNNYGNLTVDGAEIICASTSGNTEAYGIYNRAGASLSVKSGLIQAITEKDRTCYGIWNRGTIEEISGGKIVSEMIYRVNNLNNAAIRNDDGVIQRISGGEIFARSNAGNDGNYAAAILNQGHSTITEISGGYIHSEAFGAGRGTSSVVAFGIYNTGDAKIGKITGGTVEGYTSGRQWAFAVKNDGNAVIDEISGGIFRAIIDHPNEAPNAIAIANFGFAKVSVLSGGVFYAVSGTQSGGTYAIRSNDSSSVDSITGGAFYVNKGTTVFLNNNTVQSGYQLVEAGQYGYRYVVANGENVTENTSADGITATAGDKSYTLCAVSEKASVGGKVYDSVAVAIDAAADGSTVRLLGNSSTALHVPSGKNITVDLNGTTLHATLVNNGTLTLTDSVGTGRILNRTDASGSAFSVRNYGSLTVSGANIRIYGVGTNTEASAILNEKTGTLTVLSGKIQSTTQSRRYGFAIRNYGTISEIAGGELAAEITHPIDDSDAVNLNVVAISQVEGATLKLISGGSIWARSNNISGEGNYASAVRNQGGSVIEKITGGSMRAYSLKRQNDARVSFGIYNENGRIGEISGGYIAGYNTGERFTFGVKNDVNGTIDLISGGFFYAEIDNGSGTNAISIANWGKIGEISGGTLYAVNYRNDAGGAWPIRTTGAGHTAYISGGTFYSNKNYGEAVYATDSGVNTLPEGYYITGADEKGFRHVEKVDENETVVYALGSSVTFGSANRGRSFADMLDCADNGITVIKAAISGTTLLNNGANSYAARVSTAFAGQPDPDYLIVQLSTNDRGQKLGAVSDSVQTDDFDQTSTLGAIEYIIAYAKQTWDCDVIFYTGPYFNDDNYLNMVNGLKQIQDKWEIGVVDFFNCGCGMEQPAKLKPIMSDDIHPNESGYRWMARVISDYLTNTSVKDSGHTFVRGRCTECGAYAADYVAAFGQIRRHDDGTKDIRVLIESNELFLRQYDKATLSLTFTLSDGTTRTSEIDSEYLVAYASVKALDEVVKAQNHCGFFGVVITDAPDSDSLRAERVEASVTFYLGSESETFVLGGGNIK